MTLFDDVTTPALVLDRERLTRNLAAMSARARELGVALRPHLKTAKSVEVARLAVAGEAGGITVSTLREAEAFADHGFHDIVYAVGIAPSKLPRAIELVRRGVDLKVMTDSVAIAEAIAAEATERAVTLSVLIEIDCGDGRGGVAPESETLPEIGTLLHRSPATRPAGVLTHAGQSYGCRTPSAIAKVAETERSAAVNAAERLREAGVPCPVVSTGSTPTARFVRDARGITEMRPGVYMFGDLFQSGIGVCDEEAIAVSVLATVIGHHRAGGHLLLDAGGLALSKDVSAGDVTPGVGYGKVCDVETLAPTGLVVNSVSQEHGKVLVSDSGAFERFPLGSRVRILPNHACMTAAGHEGYVVTDGKGGLRRWSRINGW